MRILQWSLVVSAALALSGTARAAELGDPAPELKISEWVKGDEVTLKEGKGKTVYVVEFWATWCPPCRESIPHLSELQETYKDKDVVFIGISNEDVDTVKPFVKKMGKKMNYTVAVDDEEATNKAYMKAYGCDGIPTAFIIDKKGRVVYYGHPMDNLEDKLDQVLEGKWDLEKAKKADADRREAAKAMEPTNRYMMAVMRGKKGDKKDAELILKYGSKNGPMMNQIAWMILTDKRVKHRDLEFALKVAKAAYDATEGKDAAIVDTYARALYDNGKKADAIEMEKKAIKLCKDDKMEEEFKKALAVYESGKPTKPAGVEEDDEDDEAPAKAKPKHDDDDDDNGKKKPMDDDDD